MEVFANAPVVVNYVLSGLAMLAAVFGLFITFWKPIREFISQGEDREKRRATDSIEMSLYKALSEQVFKLSNKVEEVTRTNDNLREENNSLKSRVSSLEADEQKVERLVTKLNLKDVEIKDKESQIFKLFGSLREKDIKIQELSNRVSALEALLMSTLVCPNCNTMVPFPPIPPAQTGYAR